MKRGRKQHNRTLALKWKMSKCYTSAEYMQSLPMVPLPSIFALAFPLFSQFGSKAGKAGSTSLPPGLLTRANTEVSGWGFPHH